MRWSAVASSSRKSSRTSPRTFLPAGGETPERHPAGEHGLRAEGERRGHVGAAPDAAVEQHLQPVADRVDDVGQRLDRRHRSVELAATVIRDDDAGSPVLRGQDGILAVEDALDDDGHRNGGDEPLQVRPVERRVEQMERLAGRLRVERAPDGGQRVVVERPVDATLPVARPGHRQVDGEEDGAESGIDRLGDELRRDAVVAKDVDLQKPGAVGRCRGDVGRARGREGREAERRAGRCCRSGKALLPIRVRHALIGDRRHDDGRGDGVAEHRRRGRRRLDPAEHALTEMPRSESGDVRAERALGSGASGEELTPVGIHPREQRALRRPSASAAFPPDEPTSLGRRPGAVRPRARGPRRNSGPRARALSPEAWVVHYSHGLPDRFGPV